MKNNFGKITYKFVSYFIESHPDLSDAEKYRYLYLCMKSMVVSDNFDEIEKVLDRKDWLSDNIQIFEDFLLEEDFAHSRYKSQINKAVLMLLTKYRFGNPEYSDEINDLIGLNNLNNFDKSDTTKEFLADECVIRQLPINYALQVLKDDEAFEYLTAFDAVTYQEFYIDGKRVIPENASRKSTRIMTILFLSSKNKIEKHYQPIDNLFYGIIREKTKEDE